MMFASDMNAKDPIVTTSHEIARSALSAWLLKSTPLPTLVVDAIATVHYSNAQADSVLALGDGIMRDSATLRLASPAEHAQLLKILSPVSAIDPDRPAVILVERKTQARPYALVIIRAPDASRPNPHIILVNDTNTHIRPRSEWVAAMFDVTPAEARIVALIAQGIAVDDIAATLDVTPGTVRVICETSTASSR